MTRGSDSTGTPRRRSAATAASTASRLPRARAMWAKPAAPSGRRRERRRPMHQLQARALAKRHEVRSEAGGRVLVEVAAHAAKQPRCRTRASARGRGPRPPRGRRSSQPAHRGPPSRGRSGVGAENAIHFRMNGLVHAPASLVRRKPVEGPTDAFPEGDGGLRSQARTP